MNNMGKLGLFAGGVLFGTAGLKILTSRDAKKVYTQTTAAVLRAKESVMTTATAIKEGAADILADAKDVNEQRAVEAEAEVIEDARRDGRGEGRRVTMKCKILHESNGRMRLHAEQTRMTLRQADILEAYLRQVPGVTEVKIYDRTCDAVVLYRGARTDLTAPSPRFPMLPPRRSPRSTAAAPSAANTRISSCSPCAATILRSSSCPWPLRTVITLFRSVHYLARGTLVPAAREDSGARARRNRHRRLHAARRLRDGGQHHVPARHRRYPR